MPQFLWKPAHHRKLCNCYSLFLQADSLIKEEIQFLRVVMGHENESFDDFVKARDACQEDLMFFPARSTYGLASVAGNNEKLAALQNEFEIVKKRMDDEAKRATRLEQKIKILTHGYQVCYNHFSAFNIVFISPEMSCDFDNFA